MNKTRLAFVSDIHMSPLPEDADKYNFKQFLGYLSWRSKRQYRHKPEILKTLKNDIRSQECTHICFGGDQTNLGTEAEYRETARWLQQLASAEAISVVPGNHDAYGSACRDLMNQYWSPWMIDKRGRMVGTPFIRLFGNIAVIGLSSAVPTAPFMADGFVSEDQLSTLGTVIKDLDRDEFFRAVIIHHPPVLEVTTARRALRNSRQVQNALEKSDIDIVFHGHLHRPMKSRLIFGKKDIPVYGAASASSNGKKLPPAQYYILEVEKVGGNWQPYVRSRVYDPDQDCFAEDTLPEG